MKQQLIIYVSLLGLSLTANSTPSSTYWAPSTASCQAYKTPHLTYDTYFAQGASAGSTGSPNYPTDIGLTTGFLPFEKIQGEIGIDALLPSPDPYYLNVKICTPESSIFEASPSIGFGVYNIGLKKDINDYNIAYLVLQKSFSFGGYISAGAYQGKNKSLFINSEGDIVNSGWIAGIVSPDIQVNLKGLKKLNFVADIQTGKNSFGAWGFGTNVYFNDAVSILTGPVYFFDSQLQPGSRSMLWTLQLDADISLDNL